MIAVVAAMTFPEGNELCYPRHEQIQVGRGDARGACSRREIMFCDGDFAIDWERAAPSWSAILLGAMLPIVCGLIAITAICVGLWH
jgi:hypothetical protein